MYQLTRDVKPDTTMDELARQSNFRQKWPDNLPRPSEDSTLYRLGAFGMGVMKTIVGRPIGNVRSAKVSVSSQSLAVYIHEHTLSRKSKMPDGVCWTASPELPILLVIKQVTCALVSFVS